MALKLRGGARGGDGNLPAAVDAIDPMTVHLLGLKIEAELFAHHASEEAADRVLLPMGRAHDGRNRCSLRSAQHRQHASLFRARPAFMRRASLGLCLGRVMLLSGGLLPCNGNPLVGGDDLGCGCFSFVGGSRAAACLRGSGLRLAVDVNRFEALLGDTKRHRSSFSIASPGQERAIGADLFQQPSADEPIDGLANRFDRNICRQVNPAIFAPRSRGQNDELSIGES